MPNWNLRQVMPAQTLVCRRDTSVRAARRRDGREQSTAPSRWWMTAAGRSACSTERDALNRVVAAASTPTRPACHGDDRQAADRAPDKTPRLRAAPDVRGRLPPRAGGRGRPPGGGMVSARNALGLEISSSRRRRQERDHLAEIL